MKKDPGDMSIDWIEDQSKMIGESWILIVVRFRTALLYLQSLPLTYFYSQILVMLLCALEGASQQVEFFPQRNPTE